MDTPTVHQLLLDLHTLTGLSVHLYDAQCRGLIHHGKNSPLCFFAHTNERALADCYAFDSSCFSLAKKTGDVCVCNCPLGFYVAICPIYNSEKLIGYLQLDGAVPDTAKAREHTITHALSYLPDEETRIKEKFDATPKLTPEKLCAVPSLMRAVCGYMESGGLFPFGDVTLGLLIKRYIKHNLQSKLTLTDIAKNLHCSKATLTETFRREFGITIVQYINTARLERACTMLRNTDLPIRTISEECGFSGAEYFSSLFKKQLGISPLAYRRANAPASGETAEFSVV